MRAVRVVSFVAVLFASSMLGQNATVMGHVVAGDTQRPARFATVMLCAVPAEMGPSKADVEKMKGDKDVDFGSLMGNMLSGITIVSAQTGLDGSYVMKDVAPGDYYIFASAPGYETPRAAIQAAADAGADMSKPIPGMQTVHVGANAQTMADVSMTRGATLAGTVSWDDGSPVSGATVTVEPASGASKKLPPQYTFLTTMGSAGSTSSLLSVTDDRGKFRMSGLTPGDYVVQVSIKTGGGVAMQNGHFNLAAAMSASPIVVWGPSAMHRTDAKPVTLHVGEERTDELITVNLSDTHAVTGHVDAMDTHAAANFGTVKLVDASDDKLTRTASVDSDGNYRVEFVPSGTYKMDVSDAAIKEPNGKKSSGLFGSSMKTVRSFEDGKATVVVAASDVTGQNVDLKPKAKPDEDVDPGAVLGAMFGGGKSSD